MVIRFKYYKVQIQVYFFSKYENKNILFVIKILQNIN